MGRCPAAAVAEAGLLGELQAAVEAVAGAGAPVTAGLAGRDGGVGAGKPWRELRRAGSCSCLPAVIMAGSGTWRRLVHHTAGQSAALP